ncbi:MAG: hypothetical protein KAX33_11895, partial [Candidatus Lokiarchaeota archaeon]|nr:hypothetical protein [Candidatus Lokiarchaeota archaeon]
MATTIQISEETKKKLFIVMNQLEKMGGQRVTYDEAIIYLLEDRKTEVNKEVFLKNIKKYQGILKPGEGKALLKELRKEDYERE